ncbi:MAG: hypothetical protein ACRDRS_24805 [Pseudonocardiaceae bacterium]
MSDALSFTELAGQHVELLPARTVLSTFVQGTNGANGADSVGTIGLGGVPIVGKMFPLLSGAGNAVGSPGGNANGS